MAKVKKTTKKIPTAHALHAVTSAPQCNYTYFYQCTLELMEDTMFVSSEYGNEYHCHGLIGNSAIPYALGLVPSPYKKYTIPMHTVHFKQLAANGVYVTPASPIGVVDFKLDRFNSRPDQYNLSWGNAKGRKENYPDEGWFKLLHRGNQFIFYVIATHPVHIPQYIRLGKFMSKAKLTVYEIPNSERTEVTNTTVIMNEYLRAEDIPPTVFITQYDKTPMQHGTYLSKIVMTGDFHQLPGQDTPYYIPKGTAFYAA